jgi:hypothetical protein
LPGADLLPRAGPQLLVLVRTRLGRIRSEKGGARRRVPWDAADAKAGERGAISVLLGAEGALVAVGASARNPGICISDARVSFAAAAVAPQGVAAEFTADHARPRQLGDPGAPAVGSLRH